MPSVERSPPPAPRPKNQSPPRRSRKDAQKKSWPTYVRAKDDIHPAIPDKAPPPRKDAQKKSGPTVSVAKNGIHPAIHQKLPPPPPPPPKPIKSAMAAPKQSRKTDARDKRTGTMNEFVQTDMDKKFTDSAPEAPVSNSPIGYNLHSTTYRLP